MGPVVLDFLRNSLKSWHGFDIIRLEFHSNASGKLPNRAKMLFMKPNGKYELLRPPRLRGASMTETWLCGVAAMRWDWRLMESVAAQLLPQIA